jgi:hypothetical protein
MVSSPDHYEEAIVAGRHPIDAFRTEVAGAAEWPSQHQRVAGLKVHACLIRSGTEMPNPAVARPIVLALGRFDSPAKWYVDFAEDQVKSPG